MLRKIRRTSTLASLLAADVNVPDLAATTFETLAQNFPYQAHDRVHQDNDEHSDIEHEESAAQSKTTKHELNRIFAHYKAFGGRQGATCPKSCECNVSGRFIWFFSTSLHKWFTSFPIHRSFSVTS